MVEICLIMECLSYDFTTFYTRNSKSHDCKKRASPSGLAHRAGSCHAYSVCRVVLPEDVCYFVRLASYASKAVAIQRPQNAIYGLFSALGIYIALLRPIHL